jgi:hypothetical protein
VLLRAPELKQLSGELREMRLGFLRRGVEELATEVDSVSAAVCEPLMHRRLDPNGVVGEEQRMNVVPEWHRCVSKLPNPVQRI